jgi:uncharacterized membrane protein
MGTQADLRMDTAIGHMLRIGVTVAASVVLAGGILHLPQFHGGVQNYREFHGKVTAPMDLAPVFAGVRALNSRSIIQLGILLLIATPIARVLFCIVAFAVQKDKLYVLVSGTVFAVLLYSLFFRT